MNNNEHHNPTPKRKTWDLLIGIALVLFGSFRLYSRLQTEEDWSFRAIFTLAFILYGAYLIFRYFKNSSRI